MKIAYAELPEVVKTAISENYAAEIDAKKEFSITYPARLSELLSQIRNEAALEVNGHVIGAADFTEKEIAILKYLKKNKIASRSDLLKDVWGYAGDVDTNTVETHISRLRQKLLEKLGTELIVTKTGNYELL